MSRRVNMGAEVFRQRNVARKILIFVDGLQGLGLKSGFDRIEFRHLDVNRMGQVDDGVEAAGLGYGSAMLLREQQNCQCQSDSRDECSDFHGISTSLLIAFLVCREQAMPDISLDAARRQLLLSMEVTVSSRNHGT